MSYVITNLCIDTCDTGCVDACPVDCISGPIAVSEVRALPVAERMTRTAGLQLYIDPGNCICCGACVSACPVGAIFDEDDVPPEHHESIAKNASFFSQRT